MSFKRICVIGLGYIGLPTALMMVDCGLTVIGVDVNQTLIDDLNHSNTTPISITEPGLAELLCKAIASGRFLAVTEPLEAEVFLIVVPTPLIDNISHKADIHFVKEAAISLTGKLKKGDLVILESTSPVGTTQQMAGWLSSARPDLTFAGQTIDKPDILIGYCPERILPGRALLELKSNDRVVGGLDQTSSEKAKQFYETFTDGQILTTNARTAEMVKLTENAFRDVNIAFANEISLICDRLDIDVWELIELANHHPRVNILKPGTGVGGHCIAVDPWFLVNSTPDLARLMKTARDINDYKPDWIIGKVLAAKNKLLAINPLKREKEITVSLLGLTYKPDVNDLRESPSMVIASYLVSKTKMNLNVVEPNIDRMPQSLSTISLLPLKASIEVADIILILVAHKEFTDITPIKQEQIVIDCVGLTALT
jgi:UDP-N-acetyl-D-mannosaminuronic acid dehydrogenase